MFQRHEDYELLAFLLLIVLFVFAERARPAYEVRRRKELWIDLISLLALFTASKMSRLLLTSWSHSPTLQSWSAQATFLELWPSWLRIVVAIMCADFVIYWIHRGFHTQALWRIHMWHHSITELYWFSGFRASAIHTFLYLMPQLLLANLVFRLSFWENVIVFSTGAFAQVWAHSSVKASPTWLEWVILTPKYHRVHHSTELHGKNYGAFLTIWDRMFQTHHSPKNLPDDFPVGLGPDPIPWSQKFRMLIGV